MMCASAVFVIFFLLTSISTDAFTSPAPSALSIESSSRIVQCIRSCNTDDAFSFINLYDTPSFDIQTTTWSTIAESLQSTKSQHDVISSSSSLLLSTIDITSQQQLDKLSSITTTTTTASHSLASTLGYFVGVASILLYTPIAIRLLRTKSANGLSLSTWWCKLTSFTCLDVYNIKSGFPLAAFSETVVITVEAMVILCLVLHYQDKWKNWKTVSMAVLYILFTCWAFCSSSPQDSNVDYFFVRGPSQELLDAAQILATVLNSAALLPQLYQNFERRSSGDYSPVTAALGSGGCSIRIFTTVELAGGDMLMLLNYGVALLLNLSVLIQVVYFGIREEKQSLSSLFLADLR